MSNILHIHIFIGETYETEDGQRIPIMNPETYELETFDFTRLPGISDAEIHCVRDNKAEKSSIATDRFHQLKDAMSGESTDFNDDEDDDFTFESIEAPKETLDRIKETANTLIFNINQIISFSRIIF